MRIDEKGILKALTLGTWHDLPDLTPSLFPHLPSGHSLDIISPVKLSLISQSS